MDNIRTIRVFNLIIFSFFVFVLHLSAQFAVETTTDTDHAKIPAGAVPFKDYRGAIILDAVINDSVTIKAHFDTGAWGIAVPEKYRTLNDTVDVRVGEWTNKLKASYLEQNNTFLRWFGQDCILFGWDFFDNKILEVSYKDRYIKVLDPEELNSLEGYSCIPFRDRGKRLILTAEVQMQRKNISGDFWIDTGLNGLVFFTHNIPTEYDLSFDGTKTGRARNMYNNETRIDILAADTVKIGNSFVTHKDILFPQGEWFVFKPNDIYIGLLGNQFFHDFSVVFDFRKNYLYLKPF
jgi:hypothetical protein